MQSNAVGVKQNYLTKHGQIKNILKRKQLMVAPKKILEIFKIDLKILIVLN